MNFIKAFFEKQRNKYKQSKESDIVYTFRIHEKDGSIWILHENHAILEIEGNKTATEIVEILENFRKTAIKY